MAAGFRSASATRRPFHVMSFHYLVAIGNLATVAAVDEGVEAWRATVSLPPYAIVTVTNWAGRVPTHRAGYSAGADKIRGGDCRAAGMGSRFKLTPS